MPEAAASLRQSDSEPVPERASLGERIEEPLFAAAARESSKTAVIDGARSFTYEWMAERAESFAWTLLSRGLAAGDRVSIYLDKSIEAVVALYGTWRAGGVAVPVSDSLVSRQVEYIVRNSGSRFLVSDARHTHHLHARVLETTAGLEVGLNEGTARAPLSDSTGGASPAAILYTSGSTGPPKGILISHANLLAGARIVSKYLRIASDERIISIPPFSFDYGLNQLLTAVRCGAALVLQRSPLPADICRTLVRHEVTAMAAVPPLWIQLLQRTSPFSRMSFRHLRCITNTGGKLPTETVRQLRTILPHVRIYLMYGLSEAFRSTYLPPEEVDHRPDSIGKAIPECEVLVVSNDGRPCQPGEVGELVHCGPTVALGYWNDAESTAKVFRHHPCDPSRSAERVVYSGDLVKSDEEGFLYYIGRRDHLIKSQGYRISPTEVEDIVFETGFVREVVAKGQPDPVAGAVVVVHCVPRDPASFSPQAVLEHCRREMPRYMVPRHIYVHESFPRTASGKIDRRSVGQ
jgi:acyl-CoA ligase (AMP-forming) (exosortase A-associated)